MFFTVFKVIFFDFDFRFDKIVKEITFLKPIIPQKIACGAQFSLKTLLLSLICYLKSIIINKLKSQQQNTFARLQNNQKEQLISYASFSSVTVPEATPYGNFPVYGGKVENTQGFLRKHLVIYCTSRWAVLYQYLMILFHKDSHLYEENSGF